MTDEFLTISEAVKYTGKSRRTLHRLAHQLSKTTPEQVMRERTSKGVIWRIHKQNLQPGTSTNQSERTEVNQSPAPLAGPMSTPLEVKYLEIAQQGYGSLMAMHHEVKVTYETLLHEKDLRIQELTKALEKSQQGFWSRWFNG
jgi:predicted DNA-binding transcriptional regulator AlpA